MSQAKRISSKEYSELLKICRRWTQPYLGIVAKFIAHIAWQFGEIERLDKRLRELEQTGLETDKAKPYSPPKPTPSYQTHAPQTERWPLYKRLYFLTRQEGWESTEVLHTLKWNSLTVDAARQIVADYALSLDKD